MPTVPAATSIEMNSAELKWEVIGFQALETDLLYDILQLRQQIFIVEQNCVYQDLDNLDQQSLHLCARHNGKLLAYLRALPPGLGYAEASLGRIAVSEAARGLQLGRELVKRGIELAHRTWPTSDIKIGAQAHLEAFYTSMGFGTIGDVYDEDGIPHIKMLLRRN
jgi:ElaA protein